MGFFALREDGRPRAQQPIIPPHPHTPTPLHPTRHAPQLLPHMTCHAVPSRVALVPCGFHHRVSCGHAVQEAKKKQAEEAANVKLDKVLTAFRLVKNNKFAELEDMLVEGVDGFKSC